MSFITGSRLRDYLFLLWLLLSSTVLGLVGLNCTPDDPGTSHRPVEGENIEELPLGIYQFTETTSARFQLEEKAYNKLPITWKAEDPRDSVNGNVVTVVKTGSQRVATFIGTYTDVRGREHTVKTQLVLQN